MAKIITEEMESVTVRIRTTTPAFEANPHFAIAQILREVADSFEDFENGIVESTILSGNDVEALFDIDGKNVGEVTTEWKKIDPGATT